MNLDDLIKRFLVLGNNIVKLGGKYGVCQKERSELSLEERFIYDELSGILATAKELEDTVGYLNRDIVAEGMLSVRKGRFYINDYQIKGSRYIEFILDGDWVKTNISLVDGEYYIDLYGKRLNEGEIYARIRE